MKRPPKKQKRRSSRRQRQFRLLLLICMAAVIAFYHKPIINSVKSLFPAENQAALSLSSTVTLPAKKSAVTARKGIVYVLTDKSIKALKSNSSVLWEKELENAASSVIPSYDGVFVVQSDGSKLIRYSPLGKLTGEIPVPGPFSHVHESVNGILFEDRETCQYTWTDVYGKILGNQLIQEDHILKTEVDPDSGDTVIATLKSDGSTLESALHRYDSSGRLTGARTFRDGVLLNMRFDGSQLIVVLDDRIISLDQQMKDHWTVREPARYEAVSFGQEHLWVERIQTGVQEAKVLQCYNQDGKAIFSLPVKGSLTLLEAGEGNQVAVVLGQLIQIYSEKGILNSEIQLAKVPDKIIWLNSKHLLIYFGDSVSIENIDKRDPL